MAAAVKTAQEQRYCKRAVRVRLSFRMKLNNPWCRFLLITGRTLKRVSAFAQAH